MIGRDVLVKFRLGECCFRNKAPYRNFSFKRGYYFWSGKRVLLEQKSKRVDGWADSYCSGDDFEGQLMELRVMVELR